MIREIEPLEALGEAAVPHMRRFARRALRVADCLLQGQSHRRDDDLGFMALMFISTQADHMRSLLALVPRRDAVLVARSMIEGACQLIWASKEPEVRPRAWRAFSVVHDWRLMRSRATDGVPVPRLEKARIEQRLLKEGDPFLTKKGRVVRRGGGSLTDDCYHPDWRRGVSIRRTCSEAGATELYSMFYRHFSDWHHWGVGGLGYAVRKINTGYQYASNSWGFASGALDTGVRCLLETCRVVAAHFDHPGKEDVADLGDAYLEWTREFATSRNGHS